MYANMAQAWSINDSNDLWANSTTWFRKLHTGSYIGIMKYELTTNDVSDFTVIW